MKVIKFLILFFFTFTTKMFSQQVEREKKSNDNAILVAQTTILNNLSDQKIDLYYYDNFYDIISVILMPKQQKILYIDAETRLIQSNRAQPFFLIYPNDSLTVQLNDAGNAILKSVKEKKNVSELNFFRYLQEELKYDFLDEVKFRQKYAKTNYKKIDSLFQSNYNQSLAFLKKYSLSQVLSKTFIKRAEDYFFQQYVYSKIVTLSQNERQDKGFIKQLDSMLNGSMSTRENLKPITLTNPQSLEESIYQLINAVHTDSAIDRMYHFFNRISDDTKRQSIQFAIIKNELLNNRTKKLQITNDFLKKNTDSAYTIYINRLLAVNNFSSENQPLITKSMGNQDLDKLIKNNKGKIIYLNFWASWCVPCRRQMPSCLKIEAKYANQNILFIYLSTDENANNWVKASEELGISTKENSFLIANFKNSNLNKQFKIETIPRHIIIGKDGKIINDNAPSPDDFDLTTQLNNLLNVSQ